MITFTQYSQAVSRLYVGASEAGDVGWVGLIVPAPDARASIDLQTALQDAALQASFVFSTSVPELSDNGEAQAFFDAALNVVQSAPSARSVVWLRDVTNITPQTSVTLGLDDQGTNTNAALVAPIIPEALSLTVNSGLAVELDAASSSLRVSGSRGVYFSGPRAPDGSTATAIDSARLPFSGAQRGVFGFSVSIQRQFLASTWRWGFGFFAPNNTGDPTFDTLQLYYPLAAAQTPGPTDLLGFVAAVDPCDPLNANYRARTALSFTGAMLVQGSTQTARLDSYYCTDRGDSICLYPVGTSSTGDGEQTGRLVFQCAVKTDVEQEFVVAPDGDFVLAVPGADDRMYDLIPGLAGTETLSFQSKTSAYAGDRARFTSNQPAYASRFPYTTASPVGTPSDPTAPRLDSAWVTAWGTLVRAPAAGGAIHYVAQPRGFTLYGASDGSANAGTDVPLLVHVDPGVSLPNEGSLAFPLLPYAGLPATSSQRVLSSEQTESYETQILAPTRRAAIANATTTLSASRRRSLGGPAAAGSDTLENGVTPTGFSFRYRVADGSWTQILLGQNQYDESGASSTGQLKFENVTDPLREAFQTSDLFLVVTNSIELGQLCGARCGAEDQGNEPVFCNVMNIEDWVMEAGVGQTNRYGSYTNVMIVKGVRGSLRDWAANPDKWSQSDRFGAPTTLGNDGTLQAPDVSQLINVSQWLQDYIDAALAQDSPYFAKFKAIAQDPSWTGVLILAANVKQMPNDLAGLLAGVQDRDAFNFHHFGIEISPVDGSTAALSDTSSMFGLIYYEDPAYDSATPTSAVPPAVGVPYEFRLLVLKVLFENTSIQKFESLAQLTLNQLFNEPVDHMGGDGKYNTIVLSGTYQETDGVPSYQLASLDDNSFYFASNVLKKVEVTEVRMSTLDDTEGTTTSWFGLSGFIDFGIVQQQAGNGINAGAFDVFSFGNLSGQDQPRRGLRFTNLGIEMSFASADPGEIAYTFSIDKIAFDTLASTPRPNSLFISFALALESMVQGSAQSQPKDQGYLDVITPAARLAGVSGSTWFGLRYRLNLGTPGELAGKVNLTAFLLTAWAPRSAPASSGQTESYRAATPLQLPGSGGDSKLLSLQTVLQLSIGQLTLVNVIPTDESASSSFLLSMTDIALKFLGLLQIPPNGASSFYLFGNPSNQAGPSGLGWYAVYVKDQDQQQAVQRTACASAAAR